MPVRLFGAPASLPLGPALVAIETGAPTYGVSVRRRPGGRYVGRLDPLAIPQGGSRRERVTRFLDAEARWFERQVARAPDQWWAIFFPIWPDLEAEAGAMTEPPRPGRPAHPLAGLRWDVRDRGHPRPRRDGDRSRRHRDHRPRADRRRAGGPDDCPRPGSCRSRSSSARRSRPAAATCSRLFIEEPIRPYRSLRSTIAADPRRRVAWPSRPIRSCPTRCAPRAASSVASCPNPIRAVHPDAPRDVQPDDARPAVARAGSSSSPPTRAWPPSATAMPTSPRRSASAGRRSRDASAADLRRGDRRSPDPCGMGASTQRAARSATFGRQLRKYGRDVRDEVRGRVRRDGTGRDHGYPGGRSTAAAL